MSVLRFSWVGSGSPFGRFDSSFSEEKEAKRLYSFLVLFLQKKNEKNQLRYHSRVTIGPICVTVDFARLADAQAMQAQYRSTYGRNADAGGRIFDRQRRREVRGSVWRGRSRWRFWPCFSKESEVRP